jgi:hypothetical protein
MKHFFKLTCAAAILTAGVFSLSSFKKTKKATTAAAYQISLCNKSCEDGLNHSWTWSVTNPNPGNGLDGTLQDVSHFSIAISAQAEAALVSAEYSFDGITWISIPITVDRDPTIKNCTREDVLKFDAGTYGSEPTFYRATFNEEFSENPFATSWVKTSSKADCNLSFFTGVGGPTTN